MSTLKQPSNRYFSVYDIDSDTLDWLNYCMNGNVMKMPIEDINQFLNTVESVYDELDKEKEVAQHKRYLE